MYNAFADKDENPELPGSEWDHTFSEQNGTTKVSITIYNESLERLERILKWLYTRIENVIEQPGKSIGISKADYRKNDPESKN